MHDQLTQRLRLGIGMILLALNTVLHVLPLLLIALLKAVLRVNVVTRLCNRWLITLATSWVSVNSSMIDALTSTVIHIEGLPEPQARGHFLVLCNHQSWVDIPVLQKIFNHRLPFLRFFLKRQLIWVPLLGLAWWALDFPFMHRHAKAKLAKNPGLAGRDIAATRRACEKFKSIPVSIMNFVEGTRFTKARHRQQSSPYKHLLKPRSGGTALVLDAMGDNIDTIVEVTLVYPQGRPGFLEFMANKVPEIRVHVHMLPVPANLRGGDYQNDTVFRQHFQQWLNELWQEKDVRCAAMLDV